MKMACKRIAILTIPAIAQTTDQGATGDSASDKAAIILGGSGSMWGQIDGTAKISIAKTVIEGVVEDWDSGIEPGLIAYGHRREGDCSDIEVISPVDFVGASAPDGGTQIRIDDIGGALFYYHNINSDTLMHVNDNGIKDGWDLAFFAFPAADE